MTDDFPEFRRQTIKEFLALKDQYMASINVEGALDEVIRAALEYVRLNNYGLESPDSAASAEYAMEQLQRAARYLTMATEACDTKPVGWANFTAQEIALCQAIYDKAQLSATPIMNLVLRPHERKPDEPTV